ncbi:retinal-specific phospholipid-transporting ATPase ABCA4-like [Ixodes scapularis]
MEPVNVPQAAEKNDVRPCAASLWQLHIILWKNVYVKRLRRHYVTTILEVALVVALLLGIQEYAVTRETMKVRLDTHFPTSAPTKYWNAMPDVVAIDKVLYHPKSQYLSKLVRESFSDLGVLDVSAVDSLKNLNDAINKLNDTPTVVIGLHFKNVRSNTTGIPSSLDCVVVAGRLPLDTHVDFGEKLLSQPPGPVNEAHFVEMNTIMPIIGTLQQRHLEYLALGHNLSMEAVPPVKLQRFPYPSYIEERDISNYALVLSRFCIGMLVPFAVFAARLTDEKTSGMREMLRIVGLSDWVYWASHYLSAFFMHLITVTLMLLFLCIKHNDKGRSFIQSSDPFLVFAILMCFCSSCLLHAALLSLFFANPASAVAGAMLYWTLSSAMPFLILDQGTGHGYHFISRKHKLVTSIFPGMNLHWSFRVLNRFEKFVDTGATWSNFFDHSATPDNVTVAEIVVVGLVFDCFIALLVWYLDNVLPIGPGIAKLFYFPFTASYWVPRIEFVTTPEKTAQEKDNFEAEPNDQVVAIEIVQACKNYDTVRAVCSADLRILESQITVLLGHNGAGKSTLLNIVTGFIDSSSGTVLLGGYDIRKSTRDARESIGYCAQHNILFEDLTVEEHLLFFAIVRTSGSKEASRSRWRSTLIYSICRRFSANSCQLLA